MDSRYLGDNRVEVTLTTIEKLKLIFGFIVNGYILIGKEVKDRKTGYMKTVETRYELKLW